MYTTRVFFVMLPTIASAWLSLFQTLILICGDHESLIEVEAVGRGKLCATLHTSTPWQEQHSEMIRMLALAGVIEGDYSIDGH